MNTRLTHAWQTRWYQFRVWLLRQRYGRSYREFYRHFMKLRAARDPQAAVGGLWEEMGRLQFDTLRDRGLEPHHHLLDIGCGALRGGARFIAYLEPGHYTGIDISEDILNAGRALLPEGLLAERRPRLHVNQDLRFGAFADRAFDFALAQSVFTHMPAADIEECLRHLGRVMRDDGRFYFTVFLADAERYDPGVENFYYRQDRLETLASRTGWSLRRIDDFQHPRGQILFEARRIPEIRTDLPGSDRLPTP